jgi:hypothetical protein
MRQPPAVQSIPGFWGMKHSQELELSENSSWSCVSFLIGNTGHLFLFCLAASTFAYIMELNFRLFLLFSSSPPPSSTTFPRSHHCFPLLNTANAAAFSRFSGF